MACSAAEFFQHYFAELERRDIPAVVLHGYEHLPARTDSDVDYAVRDDDRPRLRAIQRELAAAHGWLLAQELQHQVFACYAVLVDRDEPARFLKLDVCSHYVKDRCFLVRDETLLAGRQPRGGFHIPAPAAEFIYVLAKIFGKNKVPDGYVARLRELWAQDRAGAEKEFAALLGSDLGTAAEWLDRPAADWAALNRRMRARHRYGPVLLAREAARLARRALCPTGLWVSFLGVDGAGKSTQIEQLAVRECFRRTVTHHFRPMVLAPRHDRGKVTAPHAEPPRGLLGSWLKLLLYFADFWLGYLVSIRPALARSTLVVFDRGFDDILLDQRRYRLRGCGTLARALRAFLPQPHVFIGLEVSAAQARARTPELPEAEIDRQRAALRALAADRENFHLISAEAPATEVARAVGQRLAAVLAARLAP